MEFTTILLIVIIIGAMIIFYLFSDKFSVKLAKTDIYVAPISPENKGGWVVQPTNNKCISYQFQGANDGQVYIPPLPSYNENNILNAEIIDSPPCLSDDMISAIKTTRVCTPINDDISCIMTNGNIANANDSEDIFISCDYPKCTGKLSVLSLGYSNSGDQYCLMSNGTMQICDPTNKFQLFLISNSGLLTTIKSYFTQQCLIADVNAPTINHQFSSCKIDVIPLQWGSCNAREAQLGSIASISSPDPNHPTWNTQELSSQQGTTTTSVLNSDFLITLNGTGYSIVYQNGDLTPFLTSRPGFYGANCDNTLKNSQYFPLNAWNKDHKLQICDYTENYPNNCITIPL